MIKIVGILLRQVSRQTRSYFVTHYMMLVRPVEFGKTIIPGNTSQYFRSFGNMSTSVALCIIALKMPQAAQLEQPAPSTSQVIFMIFLSAILHGVLLVLFFWYCGINAYRLQTAVTFWLNWWSCFIVTAAIGLAGLSIISGNNTVSFWFVIVGFLPSIWYSFYFVPCKWIKGMVLNGRLRRGTGEAYIFMIFLIFVFYQISEYGPLIRESMSPIFDYVS